MSENTPDPGEAYAMDAEGYLDSPISERPATPEPERCDHAESLYGRCTSCGMTWGQQAAERPATPSDDVAEYHAWQRASEAPTVYSAPLPERVCEHGVIATRCLLCALDPVTDAERPATPDPEPYDPDRDTDPMHTEDYYNGDER